MLENLKNLFEDFDFRIPKNIYDLTADFVAVLVCIVALVIIIISVCVLSKKKKERLAEAAERREAEKRQALHKAEPVRSKFVPDDKNLKIRQKLTNPNTQARTHMPAIGREVSYAADFEPKRPAAQPVQHSEPAPETKKKDVVHVEDGFVIITAAQKAKLESAYSVAVRKCAVNGTSEDLERLLDAKRMLSKNKIPQQEFKMLLTLLFPKENG